MVEGSVDIVTVDVTGMTDVININSLASMHSGMFTSVDAEEAIVAVREMGHHALDNFDRYQLSQILQTASERILTESEMRLMITKMVLRDIK